MAAERIESRDPRDLPSYTLGEAAHWLGVPQNTLRTWLVGSRYSTKAGPRRQQPVVNPAEAGPLRLSFWNLVECSVLATIRKHHGISLQKVRKALDYVARKLGRPRPLIQQQFSTDGVHLFVEQYGKLVAASEQGQTAMREILEAGLRRIERDEAGLASRLFPWHRDPTEPRIVTVDPKVAFGRPVLLDTGIPVDVLFERFAAGESIDDLANDYDVLRERIEAVVRNWLVSSAA